MLLYGGMNLKIGLDVGTSSNGLHHSPLYVLSIIMSVALIKTLTLQLTWTSCFPERWAGLVKERRSVSVWII